MDPGKNEATAGADRGMRSPEGSWTSGGRGDFTANTRVLLLVLHGGSLNQVCQAMSTLHGLENCWENTTTTGRDGMYVCMYGHHI